MRIKNLQRMTYLLIIYFFTFFLCSVFLLPSYDLAFSQSAEERTQKLVEGAKKEGKVVWYTSMSIEDSTTVLNKFKKKYPFIKTELYRAGALKLVSKLLAEYQAGRHIADVTMNSGINAETLKKEGIHAKYISPESKYYDKGSIDPDGYWTDVYINLAMIGYHTGRVPPNEIPKSWTDLTDPKWKGKMGMPDSAHDWFYEMLNYMGKEKGLEFMRKLGRQEIQFQRGRTMLAQLLAAGELSLAVTLYNTHVEKLKEKGAPVEWVAIDPVFSLIHPISVCAHAPHPNAARLLIDFVLSKEGQETIASFYRIPSRLDVDAIVPRLKKGIKIVPWDSSIVDKYEEVQKMYLQILMNR